LPEANAGADQGSLAACANDRALWICCSDYSASDRAGGIALEQSSGSGTDQLLPGNSLRSSKTKASRIPADSGGIAPQIWCATPRGRGLSSPMPPWPVEVVAGFSQGLELRRTRGRTRGC